MKACRKATKISTRLIATLPITTTRATGKPARPRLVTASTARLMSTAIRMWPATLAAKRRRARAITLAKVPMISTGTISGAIHQGPGAKWAK